jgi:hypothetical protein
MRGAPRESFYTDWKGQRSELRFQGSRALDPSRMSVALGEGHERVTDRPRRSVDAGLVDPRRDRD